MSALDIEQQLRELQERTKQEGTITISVADVPFLSWDHYESISNLVLPVGGLIGATILLFFVLSLSRRSFPLNIVRSNAAGIKGWLSPLMLCALLTVWMALIGVNFLFSLLKNVVLEPYLTGETDTPRAPALQCTVQNIQQWGTRLPVALFALEFFSAVMTWVYFLFFSGNFELGALMTLPAFFASMYDSLALEGVEPDRAAVWVTHFLFLLSLFFVFSLGTPYIIREWREAKKELQNHTQKALFKDRDEVRELKERLDIMKTKNGTVLRKRK